MTSGLLALMRQDHDQARYALGCIANPDWTNMTADMARDEARKAMGDE